jgi:hypothetical protein
MQEFELALPFSELTRQFSLIHLPATRYFLLSERVEVPNEPATVLKNEHRF